MMTATNGCDIERKEPEFYRVPPLPVVGPSIKRGERDEPQHADGSPCRAQRDGGDFPA